jgi:N-acetylmuramoyl-L-alanine amidase CwlD
MGRVWMGMLAAAMLLNSGVWATAAQANESLRLPRERQQVSPDRSSGQSSNSEEDFRYRLIVQGSSDRLLRQVRQVIPDAFRATVDGQRVIQAGLFVTQTEAEEVQRQLSSLDVETRILSIAPSVVGRSVSQSGSRSGYQYRLVVQGSSDRLLRQVRQVVPDAFRATVEGRRVIQAGLYVTREEAEAIQQQLNERDVASSISSYQPSVVVRPPQSRSGENHQYRLIVQGSSDRLLRQVRRSVPDAFRTTLNGERVIQAGLFVTREEAEAVQQQMGNLDVATNIFDVSYGVVTVRPASRPSRSVVRQGQIVIVVDPGHGGADPGAVGIGGIHEADIVLDISQEVAALLNEAGMQVVLTREDDREVDLAPRVALAESVDADLFVSIHANAISMSRPDINGVETYYYDTGAALATAIQNSLIDATGMTDRGVKQARFYVLRRTSMPAVLVEVGFVTGREDAARLSNDSFRTKIAEAITQGILRYLR